MTNILQQCERFIANRDVVKEVFRWESGYVIPVSAACLGREAADEERLRAAAALLKRETGAFSPFRGFARPVVAAMLSLEADPEACLTEALRMYEALRERFSSSSYLPLAAMSLSRLSTDYADTARRAREVYDCMKADHFFLTSSEDSVFAALMALSARTPAEAEREAEACYDRLRRTFSASNGLQSLSHVLALGEGRGEDKCDRVVSLYEALRRTGLRFGRNLELPVLGALSLLTEEIDAIAAELGEADEYLARQKGYGVFGPGTSARHMHAALILMNAAAPEQGDDLGRTAAGLAGVYAAQQAAILAACAASSAAAAANSN